MAQDLMIAQVEMLLRQGRHADAARLLITSAASGNPQACAVLAEWRIAGTIIRRDLVAARALLARVAAAGGPEAALLHASFLAAGVGGADDWQAARSALTDLAAKQSQAQAQIRLLEKMELDDQGFPSVLPTGRLLSEGPWIMAFEAFATEEECKYLRTKIAAALTPSTVIDPASGQMVPHPIRSSDGAIFGVFDEDLVVNAINRRIAAASGTQPAQGEPLQLLRYRPGGEYRAHLDAIPGGGSQRILTLLLYLSDQYSGGETRFMRTGLTFRGRTGDALLFRNVTADGRPDPLALHAGLPVTRGEKLIATRWIRDSAFSYPPPRPRVDL
jgi:prolyl 4-hydroxylase